MKLIRLLILCINIRKLVQKPSKNLTKEELQDQSKELVRKLRKRLLKKLILKLIPFFLYSYNALFLSKFNV
jgi:hypothetical protein